MRAFIFTFASLLALVISGGSALAQADQEPLSYFRSDAFNAPLLEGWQDQSGDDFAQFHQAEAQATIRTAMVENEDPIAAAQAELKRAFGIAPGPPLYQDKVNLADGTWQVLLFEPDAVVSASVMARRAGARTVVISLVEADPGARALMLTIAQGGDPREDAVTEMAGALSLLAPASSVDWSGASALALPSGQWTKVAGDSWLALGMVFGNDSFIALGEGDASMLPALADAYNRTVLGFFITPDNSAYLALALVASLGILALLILSFVWRARLIQQDLQLIESLSQTDE